MFLIQYFWVHGILPFSKSYPEIESTWPTAKCRSRKSFDTLYNIVTCFSKTYSEIESTWPINSSKEEIVLSHDNNKLFVQLFVKVFDQKWKHVDEGNQRTGTQLTLLYLGRTARSSYRRCCIRKLFLKILQYP